MASDTVRMMSQPWCSCAARGLGFHGLAEPSKPILVQPVWRHPVRVVPLSLIINGTNADFEIWSSRMIVVLTEISRVVGAHFVGQVWGNWPERVMGIERSAFCLLLPERGSPMISGLVRR